MGRFNLRDVRGVGVSRVVQDSPAGRAGLRENDVILRFDGEVVSSIRKLNRLIDEVPPEHTARLSISRNGSEQEINVKLGNRQNFPGIYRGEMFTPEQSREWQQRGDEMRRHGDELRRQSDEMRRRGEEMAKREGEMRLRGDQMRKQTEEMLRGNPNLFTMNFGASRRIGVSTSRLTKQLAEYFGVDEERGVLVSSVAENSPAARAGIRAGDVITEVDGERISQSNDISRAINRKKDGEINITIVRDKKRRTIRLMPEQSQSPNMEFFMDEMAFAPGAIHLPRININPPNVHLAPLPNISLPNINLPNINLPNMNLNINPQIITPQRLRPMKLRGGSVLL
jgi:C-terminal processing protease CtpA/Prc